MDDGGNFVEYLRKVVALEILIREDRGDDVEADDIRDDLDVHFYHFARSPIVLDIIHEMVAIHLGDVQIPRKRDE